MSYVSSLAQLEALYTPAPAAASTTKVAHTMTPHYRRLIEASPFAALATIGPEGIDCSPRGDQPGFVRVHDDTTLMMPDRRGNNRIDSLRNIVRDERCAFLFLLPGSGTTFRANGRARISIDPDLLESFAVEGKPPRSVIVMKIDELYFQCARAIIRAELWNPQKHLDPSSLPTPGEILAGMTDSQVGGDAYDKAWPERAKQTMW
ncbi:pyridoxamine 5'-phosphate oxidase family protein [Devosia neptuniae]|jgi:PPOX class probable FMN-dependent enzyme|uniref:pyridoxamine 5'-phosphate oxidase family protein n=1 Tax=Devosia TaxID=46913 RepID=UPI0022AF14CD|nr:pyridoxamine 5'-phosphate oxidase family protein [Devosia neptuniae]MCZ4346526.1 pyridoxamine 5'-phosphate oxidase family protein [Devosia neptuniae]|tara:strand:+ start:30018 stop:30632 length:615 start_codon:yes stop_codon:yes gene_type:complete